MILMVLNAIYVPYDTSESDIFRISKIECLQNKLLIRNESNLRIRQIQKNLKQIEILNSFDNKYKTFISFIFMQSEIPNEEITQKPNEPLQIHQEQKLDPKLYTVFRLDGHTFSSFVKKFKMNLPFDSNFTTAMKNTASQCIDYFNAFIGFVGSDEITYALRPLTQEQLAKNATLPFNGRVEKMVSLLAGKVSTIFFIELTKLEGFEKTQQFTPHFDCRVFQVASLKDVLGGISERVKFTLKNSRMMLAQSHFSPKQLNKVPSKQAVELLLQKKGIDFNETVPGDNRVGTVLTFEICKDEKEIEVKGEKKTINFERRKCLMRNLGPKEVLDLDQKSLV